MSYQEQMKNFVALKTSELENEFIKRVNTLEETFKKEVQ